MVCVVRDPGPVDTQGARGEEERDDQPLLEDEEVSKPGRYCQKCRIAKPERVRKPLYSECTMINFGLCLGPPL